MEQDYNPNLELADLKEILGAALFDKERQLNNEIPGVVTGLAWTAVGGDILFIESSMSSGKGKLSITGNLGKVMKESSTIAMQYIKSHAETLGINNELLTQDVHIRA